MIYSISLVLFIYFNFLFQIFKTFPSPEYVLITSVSFLFTSFSYVLSQTHQRLLRAQPLRRRQQPSSAGATQISSLVSLVNTIVGAGTLGLPLAFAKAGLVPSLIIFVIMLSLTLLSLYYVVYSSDATLLYSYGEVCIIFSFNPQCLFLYSWRLIFMDLSVFFSLH